MPKSTWCAWFASPCCASTGAAAAIVASERADLVRAVVARGGRVDLAGDALARVHAPVLMVVGGADRETLELNRASAQRLAGRSQISVVRGAGHTFDEPGALGAVGERVVSWLGRFEPTNALETRTQGHRTLVGWRPARPLKTGGFHRLMNASPRRPE